MVSSLSSAGAAVLHAEAVVERHASMCQETRSKAEHILDKAMPLLMRAHKKLDTLRKNDLTEIKSMSKPPYGVVCLMRH